MSSDLSTPTSNRQSKSLHDSEALDDYFTTDESSFLPHNTQAVIFPIGLEASELNSNHHDDKYTEKESNTHDDTISSLATKTRTAAAAATTTTTVLDASDTLDNDLTNEFGKFPLKLNTFVERVRPISNASSPAATATATTTPSSPYTPVESTGVELIPLMFSHRIYRFNIHLNTYEMVADEYAVTGWRHIYIAIQNETEVICISERSGQVYRKVIRSSLQHKVGEADSFTISSSIHNWNDTRILLYYNNELLFIRSKDIYQLDLEKYEFKLKKNNGVGNWKKSVYLALKNKVYGVDQDNGSISFYDLETDQITKLNVFRNWNDAAGIVFYNSRLIIFTNNGIYKMHPETGEYKLCAREEKWSMYTGCVAKVNDTKVIFVSFGNLYVWDLKTNTYKLLSYRWNVVNCITTFQLDDIRDRNFLKNGSSLKGA